MNFINYRLIALLLFVWIMAPMSGMGQKKKKEIPAPTLQKATSLPYDSKYFTSLKWRGIGPFRGGRSCTVTGVPNQPDLYYFGSVGGGVWKTTNGGDSWTNISDGYFGGSIGCVSVSTADPNVIYVGTGEQTVRGNVSIGIGLFKSEDAGETWTFSGLDNSRHISRIRIHPQNPDVAWVAVMGDLFKSSPDRGVYKTVDGGKTWKKVLFANDDAGAVDLILDPNNPRILYASTWRVRRMPHGMESGGDGSALWKSNDSGETWTNISSNKGLPKGIWGISGVTVSPANSQRVWAIIEHADGGVFRTDDAGKTWTKLNSDRNLRQRAWYYSRIYADTKDAETVYVLNVSYHKSTDGGRTFSTENANHGDHHDLWIAPEDNKRMIIGDDGGGQVSYDGGRNWSTYENQPTAQFYRVITDNSFPFRILGAQQDNTTVRIKHRSEGFAIGDSDWDVTAGCECGFLAPDPLNSQIVFGGCYDGVIEMQDHKNNQNRYVNVWPDNPMGHGAEGMKYRFQWNFPILFSQHNPRKLITASNHIHISNNYGQSWQTISPDLTRNDPSKLGPSGGPITKDNTSVEYYCTVFAVAESPRNEKILWAGSDDGLIHVTRDGGQNWENVTPKDFPQWIQVNSIEADPHAEGSAYVAATMYKSGDYKPYLFKTKDYGKTWTRIVEGIKLDHFTRVIRADLSRPGLLYAGTEFGMYLSFDDGANWQSFQLNLPIVPITDLTIKNNTLIAATQGRSFWLVDDLTPLHQLNDQVTSAKVHLFKPMDAYRMNGGGFSRRDGGVTSGTNHPGGVIIQYYLDEEPGAKDTVELEFSDDKGRKIITLSNHAKERVNQITVTKGGNQTNWNLMYPAAENFEGMILWAATLSGPKATPGDYKVTLRYKGVVQTQDFKVIKDPRTTATLEDIQKQFDFVDGIGKKLTETHRIINEIRSVKSQMKNYQNLIEGRNDLMEITQKMKNIDSVITKIEESLYQTKNQSGQDPLNFPIRLNNKLASLNAMVMGNDFPPTDQAVAVRDEIASLIDTELTKFRQTINTEVQALNTLIRTKGVDAILLKPKKN